MRMPAWTIRTRLIVTLAMVAAVVIITSGVVTVLTVQHHLDDQISDRLVGNSQRIKATLLGMSAIDVTAQTVDQMATAESTAVIMVQDGQPVLTANSDPATTRAVLGLDLADGKPRPVPGHPGMMAVEIDTADSHLVIDNGGRKIRPDGLIIAVDTTQQVAAFQGLVFASTATSLGAIAILVLLTIVIVSRGIRPLRTMSAQAQAFADGERSTRLSVPVDDPDISRLATTVNEAFDAQQEADDRLRAFVADASHELRTPLTTASGWIELYLQGGLTDLARRDQAMQRAQAELGRMRTLIDELAMLARLDATRPLELEPMDLSALAAEVVDDARVANPGRTVTLFASGAAPLLGDRRKLQQVLVNLVGNAVQHTPAGTPVEVTVAPASAPARTQSGWAQAGWAPSGWDRSGWDRSGWGHAYTLLVTDHGPGIPAADQAHVFERFWRGDTSRDRHTGGSGLGLSIVASIVTAHGGTYGLSSRVGEGTTVRVTLPGLDPGREAPTADPVALSSSPV